MNQTLTTLLVAIGSLGIYVVCHCLLSRYCQPVRWWALIRNLFCVLASLTVGGIIIVGHQAGRSPASLESSLPIDLFAILLTLWLIHVGYLTFYGFIDRSISLRMMVEMKRAGWRPLTYEELKGKYDLVAAFKRRLMILECSGYLRNTSRGYTLTSKGIFVGRLVCGLKNLYRVGKGG